MKLSELCWCAGFFEGEGCIYVDKKGRAFLSVSQNHPEPLLKLERVLGGKVRGPYRASRSRNPKWVWSLNRQEEVVQTLELLEPHLVIKAEKARQVLNSYVGVCFRLGI